MTAGGRHWFYDSRLMVCSFCLLSVVAIFWQVSQFEGFRPILTCATAKDVDRLLLFSGMDACMGNARSRPEAERCIRTVYVLACMTKRWW
ncbi:hypothetical protein MKK69_25430 [Methylobacterium sp. J-026]|uniref:hypothetical protein n=1 Tax=Methylobacterium sp. J-026 TaxID=2836624 RepID=UPI001FB9485F|nr:hypothetical protein [Methylobacterium sp. J-026]MCJ2137346.1 hypothetical protein [Methylobacterium sp. J-026]